MMDGSEEDEDEAAVLAAADQRLSLIDSLAGLIP
jgi:hypothetical protein